MKLTSIPADTTPEAAWVQIEVFRRMWPRKRLHMALQLSDSLRAIAAAGVKSRHPEFSAEHVKLAVIRMSLGGDLFRRAYPGVSVAP
jgi:hypothetical protein